MMRRGDRLVGGKAHDMDVAKMVGAVSRVVGTRDQDGRPARVVVARRRYAGAADEVWDALTKDRKSVV